MKTKDQTPFTITEALHESRYERLLRGIRTTDGRPVLLKVVDPRIGRPRDVERLRHEHAIGKDLDLPAIVKPLGLETHAGMLVLVLEDFGGDPLERSIGAPMAVGRFLDLALRIAAAVADLHERDVLHGDLKPRNILVDAATGQVKLADLGLAASLPREQETAGRPGLIEGSLPYLAPERTGRMNRAVDGRADLYALGVTFYEMLTGRLPFEARDPLEWLHCHVARVPRPPSQRVREVPEIVSAIVMKLLAKMPEDRYQTARGLQHDLERCLADHRARGSIEPFPLAERDLSDRFQIPQRLYGRAAEAAALLAALGRVVETGSPELVLVSGPSGIGKSALVAGLSGSVVRERGSFVAGKCDRAKHDIAYSAIVLALRELVLEVLAGSEQRILAVRDRLLGALGSSGRVLVDLIPQVELVIGPQPEVAELPPAEQQGRLRLVLRRFLGALAREEHPVALFLDDLQWVDPASLGLVEELCTHPETRHLLVIGAYRDGEVCASHPLLKMVDEARKQGARVSDIVLGPLSREHVAGIVGDTLHCGAREVEELASLVHEKTAGNPFFLRQFLAALHGERLVELDGRAGVWRCDIAGIRAKGFTDNVVELVIEKLAHLPERTRAALEQLACLGNGADSALLSAAGGRSEPQTHADLREAVRAGLVLRLEDGYEFLHDRVQEAAYALVPPERRAEAHLEIGRRLLAALPERVVEERVFDVVRQLDKGAALVTDPREKEALRRLDVRAGRKAKASLAHASARRYLARAAALLPPDAWSARYEETLSLHLEAAECEYLAGAPERAQALFDLALQNARTALDRAAVHRARLRFHQVAGRFDDAVAVMREALRLFGVTLPETEAEIQAAAEAELRQVPFHLRGRRIADLASAPAAEDPETPVLQGVIADAMPFVYSSFPSLCRLLTVKGVNLCLERGHTDASALIYSCYSSLLAAEQRDIPSALRFSEMALALGEELGSAAATQKTQMLFHHAALINPWSRHFATSVPLIEQAITARLDVGDVLGAGYMAYPMVWLLLEAGEPLDHVLEVARRYATLARQGRNDVVYTILRVEEQLAASLSGATRPPTSLDDGAFDEARCVALLEGASFSAGIACYRLAKLVTAFFHERYDEAMEYALSFLHVSRAVEGMANEATHCFFHALTLAALHPQAPAERRREMAETLERQRQKLKIWADSCPENFQNRHDLVAAEIARVEGRDLEAMRLYESAIRSARDNGFVHNEAVAGEIASRFYRERGFGLIADTYLREARACYARWGADGKVRQIDKRHPGLVEPKAAPADTFAVRPEQLDLLSVTKASQTISGEIVLDELIRTLLAVVLEQGGAQRGLLILSSGGALTIEAEAGMEQRGVVTTLLPPEPVGSSQRVPVSVVHYVVRTKERVILTDADADAGKHAGDDYFRRRRPRSVLCLPVLRQAEMVGVLYLENDLLAGAFTPERLTALSLLATQAAIAIDNARLYRKTQEAIQARNEFLSIASHELRTPITSLAITLQSVDRALQGGACLDRPTLSKMIGRALRQGARLVRLSEDLLDVSRIHAGKLTLEPEEVDLGALAREVVEQLKLDLARAQCAVSITGSAQVVGRWDRARIEQILTNLISNALKFGAGKPIEITLTEAAGTARLAVRDHGIGIEPEKQALIFERFERAVSARHYGGLGLGLYISRSIAEAHGGTLRVESEPGAGSTFTVELPIAGPASFRRAENLAL